MITSTKNTGLDELADKIINGVNKAVLKLVKETAAKDGTLIVSDGKGNPKAVPAKELLKTFPEEDL